MDKEKIIKLSAAVGAFVAIATIGGIIAYKKCKRRCICCGDCCDDMFEDEFEDEDDTEPKCSCSCKE